MGPSLPATRVAALVGGLALVGAFFMPWFAAQGLLLSGHFLHDFLATAGPADLQRFMPGVGPGEVQALRLLVDLFPACGALAAAVSLLGSARPGLQGMVGALLALSGLVPLVAWAVGQARLPVGSSPEIGLWLIAAASLLIVLAGATELMFANRRVST